MRFTDFLPVSGCQLNENARQDVNDDPWEGDLELVGREPWPESWRFRKCQWSPMTQFQVFPATNWIHHDGSRYYSANSPTRGAPLHRIALCLVPHALILTVHCNAASSLALVEQRLACVQVTRRTKPNVGNVTDLPHSESRVKLRCTVLVWGDTYISIE